MHSNEKLNFGLSKLENSVNFLVSHEFFGETSMSVACKSKTSNVFPSYNFTFDWKAVAMICMEELRWLFLIYKVNKLDLLWGALL